MKIITLKRKTLDGEPFEPTDRNDGTDWWCVIETEEEDMVYRDFEKHLGEYTNPREVLWNKMMIHAGQPQGLCWGDDDVYGYLSPDEDVPEIGEEMVDSDGDIWERIG